METKDQRGLDNYQLAHIMAHLYPNDSKTDSIVKSLLKNEEKEKITPTHNPEDTFPMHLIRWNRSYE
jgi:hypothetical protein